MLARTILIGGDRKDTLSWRGTDFKLGSLGAILRGASLRRNITVGRAL